MRDGHGNDLGDLITATEIQLLVLSGVVPTKGKGVSVIRISKDDPDKISEITRGRDLVAAMREANAWRIGSGAM